MFFNHPQIEIIWGFKAAVTPETRKLISQFSKSKEMSEFENQEKEPTNKNPESGEEGSFDHGNPAAAAAHPFFNENDNNHSFVSFDDGKLVNETPCKSLVYFGVQAVTPL